MRIVTSSDIEALNISPLTCYDWVREAFAMKSRAQLPPKISLHPQGNDFFNTMPCLLPEEYHTFGCKVVSRIKGTHPALKTDMMIFNSENGEMEALMEGNWITAARTGAVATLAIKTLRCPGANIYAFMGLGVMGRTTLASLLEVDADEPKTIRLLRYKDHAERVIADFAGAPNASFEIVDTHEGLVDGADVVVSCITDADGLIVQDTDLFKSGALVVPVHTRGFQNCDRVFDRVIADDRGHVEGFRFFNEFRAFAEIGDVIAGRAPGRQNAVERILAYNIGIALHDILFAHKILNLLRQ